MKRRYPDRSNSSPPRYLSLRIDQYTRERFVWQRVFLCFAVNKTSAFTFNTMSIKIFFLLSDVFACLFNY